MPYYLRHYFDPDFKHEKLTPQFTSDGSMTYFYLGYVQNVVQGQVVAEVIDLDQHPEITDYDPRFISAEPHFPCGPNCIPHPGKPSRMIATANGYCFYNKGLITIKKLLNVRRNIDFHTGNIMFVGDVIAHESVQSGFTLHGNNILVKGTVENALIRAAGNIVCESGIKGGGNGHLKSNGNVKAPFCENITIEADGNIELDGSCMHSTLHAEGSIMVKGRLQGGEACAGRVIFAQNQLGGHSTPTKIILGFSPRRLRHKRALEKHLEELLPVLERFERVIEKKPKLMSEFSLQIRLLQRKIKVRNAQLRSLNAELAAQAANAAGCRLICPGKIESGTEITIGEATYQVTDFVHGREFRLENGEVVAKKLT
ncbi:MAG: FapA family protein [Deltaproteobacteria bacterium]|jgi:uncharacterized protein (DUF342 family)|nr:FapA family protein [Deltaproteobacteria bacterium]